MNLKIHSFCLDSGLLSTFASHWVEFPINRVVYRGSYSAYAYGGVSYAGAYYDASNASTIIGSRLEINQQLSML